MAEDAPKEIPGFKLNALREIIKQHFNADTVSVVYLTEGGFNSVCIYLSGAIHHSDYRIFRRSMIVI